MSVSEKERQPEKTGVPVSADLPPDAIQKDAGARPRKPYAKFDFVLMAIGLAIAFAIGSVGAGVEIGISSWTSNWYWISGFVGGSISALGGILAAVFFLNVVSTFLYNRNTDRWQQNKEYPKTWHAFLLLIFAIIEPSAILVVLILGAIGGGIGYGAAMNLAGPWSAIAFTFAIPAIACAVALWLIYDFADGVTA